MALTIRVFADARTAERRQVDGDGTVRGPQMEPIDARVLDVSETGFRIMTDVGFEIGQQITLGFGGWGMRDARVVRANGREFGCEFLTPMPHDVLEQALRAVTVVEGSFNPLASPEALAQPQVDERGEPKYSDRVRIATAIGAGILLWAAIAAIYLLIF